MYKYLFLLAALSSCTFHQQERFLEIVEQPEGAFHRQRALHLVRESMTYPRSDLFSLEVAVDKGLPILKGDLLPLEERLVLAEVEDGAINPLYEFEILENGELKLYTPSGIQFQKEITLLSGKKEVHYVLASYETFDCAEASFTIEGPTEIYFSINQLPDQIDIEKEHTVLS